MRTRKGLEDTITGILISEIDECNTSGGLARKTAIHILDYLAEEENLIIPHVSKRSELLFAFMRKLGIDPDIEENEYKVYNFLVEQSKL